MTLSRPVLVLLCSSSLLGAGCALHTPERRMVPTGPASVQQELGYNDVIQLSHDYALAQGYDVSDVAEATQVRPNYWRVRFGLAPRGSGRLMDLEFDPVQRRVLGATEFGGTGVGGSGSTGAAGRGPVR